MSSPSFRIIHVLTFFPQPQQQQQQLSIKEELVDPKQPYQVVQICSSSPPSIPIELFQRKIQSMACSPDKSLTLIVLHPAAIAIKNVLLATTANFKLPLNAFFVEGIPMSESPEILYRAITLKRMFPQQSFANCVRIAHGKNGNEHVLCMEAAGIQKQTSTTTTTTTTVMCGGLVLAPILGVHDQYVAAIDIASNYPNLVVNFKIDPSVFNTPEFLQHPDVIHWLEDIRDDARFDNVYLLILSMRTTKQQQCLRLPELMRCLLFARQQSPNPKDKTAWKLMANSILGQFGEDTAMNCYFNPLIYNIITALGRHLLHSLQIVCTRHVEVGGNVIAGDTDSIFFKFAIYSSTNNNNNPMQYLEKVIVPKISKYLKDDFSHEPTLRVDGLYDRIVYYGKKNYIAKKHGGGGDLLTRGMLIGRKDFPPFGIDFMNSIVAEILNRGDDDNSDQTSQRIMKLCSEFANPTTSLSLMPLEMFIIPQAHSNPSYRGKVWKKKATLSDPPSSSSFVDDLDFEHYLKTYLLNPLAKLLSVVVGGYTNDEKLTLTRVREALLGITGPPPPPSTITRQQQPPTEITTGLLIAMHNMQFSQPKFTRYWRQSAHPPLVDESYGKVNLTSLFGQAQLCVVQKRKFGDDGDDDLETKRIKENI